MPAIDLNRLHIRISLLKETFSSPSGFVAGLREIFSLYSDRTFPLPNYHSEIHSQPAFNTPPLLNREFERALSGYCTEQPDNLLTILDLLWHQPEIELRQLAADLLGKLSLEYKETVISRIVSWSQNVKDAMLLPYLHEHGSATLRRLEPQAWLNVLDTWKYSSEKWQTRLSIQGLISLIDDRDFENLPSIFSFLSPLYHNFDPDLQYDLHIALEHLINRSEVETVFFVKQLISSSKKQQFGRFIRRSLDEFSPVMQKSLREALRNNEKLQS